MKSTSLHRPAMAAGTVMVLCSCALGEVVRYSNLSGQYVMIPGHAQNFGSPFDPNLSPEAQPTGVTTGSFRYVVPVLSQPNTPLADVLTVINPEGIALFREATASRTIINPAGMRFSAVAMREFVDGDVIGPTTGVPARNGAFAWNIPFQNPVRQRFLSQSPVIGFRMPVFPGFRYGYVQFNWQLSPRGDGEFIYMYQPIFWAYESTLNVPITVPTPSAALAFALPVGLFALRRRRGSSHSQFSI